MVRDVTLACDRLFRVYEATQGADGYVSIEVDPTCARDAERSIQAARRLWRAVARPNLMVKIPGTIEGLAAVETLLVLGININITLLFSVERYAEIAETYMRALEARLQQNERIDRISSVASFFVSRVDTKVDHALDNLRGSRRACGSALRGRIAIANADIAYAHFREVMGSDRWKKLAARGARPQRLLWASTSTKDPAYRDLHYVEALVAPDTVDTMTLESLRAFRDHGKPETRLGIDPSTSRARMADLASLKIDFETILGELEDEGIAKFSESHAMALETIANARRSEHPSP
jgi:transaldolase